MTLEECKAHLQCFRIIPNQGTHILTIKFDHIKPCIVMKSMNPVEKVREPVEEQRPVDTSSVIHRDLGDHFPDCDVGQFARRVRQETVS